MTQKFFRVLLLIFGLHISKNSSTRILFQFGEDPKDLPNNVTLEQFQDKTFTYFVSGFDYENRPVVVMPWGSWDINWLVKHPELLEKFEKHYDGHVEEIRTGKFAQNLKIFSSDKNDSNDEIVVITDFDGFQFSHMNTPEAIKFVVSLNSRLEKCYAQIAYGFDINANPLAYQIMILSKPSAGRLMERMEIFGTNSQKWIPRMNRKIPADQLPTAYGGPADFKPLVTFNFLE